MSGVLILGRGLLGSELARAWPNATIVGRETLDLTADSINLPPGEWQWVINAAAYTSVDRAESEARLAMQANAIGPGRLAAACRERGAILLSISTDFVFGGDLGRPYVEDDEPRPLGVYARTKREGEVRILDQGGVIVRTAWLFGDGPCFPRTMVRLYKEGRDLRVVNDQFGSPTWTRDVAAGLKTLMEGEPAGIYHVAGSEVVSWHELAERSLRAWTGHRVPVTPITTDDFPTAAPRPRYSALSIAKMAQLGYAPTPLDEALRAWATESS
ncbi:MAG: dTDP-4-dehydrorhamnose reductase [Armatimonadota bacterium]